MSSLNTWVVQCVPQNLEFHFLRILSESLWVFWEFYTHNLHVLLYFQFLKAWTSVWCLVKGKYILPWTQQFCIHKKNDSNKPALQGFQPFIVEDWCLFFNGFDENLIKPPPRSTLILSTKSFLKMVIPLLLLQSPFGLSVICPIGAVTLGWSLWLS